MDRPNDPRTRLIDAAERLLADHGPDGVSLRDIARAAGQRNNSAVHYHFGSRENLIAEVFRRRMIEINKVRAERLGELEVAGEANELANLVAVFVTPLADHVREAGPQSTYAQFMVRSMADVGFDNAAFEDINAVQVDLWRRIRRLLSHLDGPAFNRRAALAITMSVSALADFERRWNLGHVDEQALAITVAEIVAMTSAALQAPPR